jgi:hypothetical protein
MDHTQARLEALEQRTHTVERQLRWWRGLAGGLLVLAVLTWALPVVTADDAKHDDKKTLEERVAALEKLLKHFRRDGNEVFIKGANLHIVNGLGSTDCFLEGIPIPDCPNGLGNLIVGYNEPRADVDFRTGSHNVVVGPEHNFSSFGGLVVGVHNEISSESAVVSGGGSNTHADPPEGTGNTASGDVSSVSGGSGNTAVREFSAVSGGQNRTAAGEFDWVAGSLVEDE